MKISLLLLSLTLLISTRSQKVDHTVKIQSLKTSNFESMTKNQGPDVVSFVMFSAGWCGHCTNFLSGGYGNFIEAVSKDTTHPYIIRYYNHKMDDKENTREYFNRFKIRGFPSFVAIKDNKIYRHEGARTPEKLLEFTRNLQGGEPFPEVRIHFFEIFF